jgi:DNA helicase IV
MRPDAPLFPELDDERRQLDHARACRDRMIDRFEQLDPDASADEVTKDYIEVTVLDALADLRMPGAGDFFGRIDEEPQRPGASADRWYIGRRHIEDDDHHPVVVDWRAPIAAPFYRATVHDPLGLAHRRRFTLADGDLTAYLDENLADPSAADVATGVPDPVLAEIGAARTGAMREIVATIQAEQDVVIRAAADQCLVVQGGPGTGKTAVGLHRAAYLLFEHRRRLMREGVLVVGPNSVFLDYIAEVLPSLGERNVQQRTVAELCVPRVEVLGTDPVEVARLKGDPRMLSVLERAVRLAIKPPADAVRIPTGARTLVLEAEQIAGWIDTVLRTSSESRLNHRREALRAIATTDLMRRTGQDDIMQRAPGVKAALNAAWPSQQPKAVLQRLFGDRSAFESVGTDVFDAAEIDVLLAAGRPGTKKVPWTLADQLLLDETNSLLNGPPFVFGHLVVDEAQDQSAVGLRVIGRRSPSDSMTILGDLAQSTTPAGQRDWDAVLGHLGATAGQVAHLTIGYRVPAPILDVANRLLPHTGVDTVASRSVRVEGSPPVIEVVPTEQVVAAAVAAVRAARHHHRLTGVVAPARLHHELADALAADGYRAVGHVQALADDEIPLFTAEAVKGLEFDGVVVVNPGEIFDGTERGARLLYVAMTRAVQELHMVGDTPLHL